MRSDCLMVVNVEAGKAPDKQGTQERGPGV